MLTALAFFTFIGFGLNAGLMGVIWPSLRNTFGVGNDAFAALSLLILPFGLIVAFSSAALLRRLGTGTALMISFAAGSLGTLGYALAPAWWVVVAFRLFTVVGTGLINPGINMYMATHESAGRMTWLHACFGLGATISPSILTLILDAGFSWRWGYAIIVVLDAALALCFALTRKRWPSPRPVARGKEPAAPPAHARTWALPAVWLSALLFLAFSGMEGSSGQWPYTLFTEGRGIEPVTAGVWASAYWASVTAGRIFFGFVADRMDSGLLIRLCMSGAVLGALLVWIPPLPLLGFLGLALIGFSLAPLFPVLTSSTPERLGEAHAADAIGYQIVGVQLGRASIPALGGVLAENLGVSSIGPFLFAVAGAAFLLHEATLRVERAKGRV